MFGKFKKINLLFLLVFFTSQPLHLFSQESKYPEVTFKSDDRILILAPHPDDEVLGCGGIIQKALALKLPLKVVFLTHGDANEWAFAVYKKHLVLKGIELQKMGMIRHTEAVNACKKLGLSEDQLVFLGYPDNGTIRIWEKNWGYADPFRSGFTKATSVPYTNALRPGAAYKGEEILTDIKSVLTEFKPSKIFVSHPADQNPDHRAYYLFTQVALWDLNLNPAPEVFPFLIHYHFRDWPLMQGYHPEEPLFPPTQFDQEIKWSISPVSQIEADIKYEALKMHKTQFGYSSKYLSSFIRTNELFGDFPLINVICSTSPFNLNKHLTKLPDIPEEELTDEERASLLGMEKKTVAVSDGKLILNITYSRPWVAETSITVLAFGYRKDQPFQELPKIRIQCGMVTRKIFDRGVRVKKTDIRIVRHAKQVIIEIPIETLGNPDKIFLSARSYLVDIPLDWISWRTIQLSGNKLLDCPVDKPRP